MPDITISLTDRELVVLTKVATDNGMSPDEYMLSIARSYLIGKLRGYYQSVFNDKSLLELLAIFGEPPW